MTKNKMMKLSDFDYNLPQGLIAQRPLDRRDQSRLMVVDRSNGTIAHKRFTDLIDYLDKGDCMVLNDTKVNPVRFIGKKQSGGKVDVILLEKTDKRRFRCLVKSNSPIKPGTTVEFKKGLFSGIINSGHNGFKEIFFNIDIKDVKNQGLMPLPPYIKRLPDAKDRLTYQTVFAKRPGAVAAPTAGLHFTKRSLRDIRKKGIKTAFITLHVGYGTFNPVTEEDITRHKMHSEWFSVSQEASDGINMARKNGGRILAVGTTSCRALEASACAQSTEYRVQSTEQLTDLFIYPGYHFKMTDMLLTNFHLPRTTLLMLVAAFCGKELMGDAYRQAIDRRYRFYSYGDAMLIL